MVGYDTTAQYTDMGAATIVWDDTPGRLGDTLYGTWRRFEVGPFLVSPGQETLSVWFRTKMKFAVTGGQADFDDLDVIEAGALSGSNGWELYR